MMPSMNPDQLAKLQQLQQITQHIFVVIEVDNVQNVVKIAFTSQDAGATAQIPALIQQLVDSFAQQLESFFGIKGKIVEIGG